MVSQVAVQCGTCLLLLRRIDLNSRRTRKLRIEIRPQGSGHQIFPVCYWISFYPILSVSLRLPEKWRRV